MVSIDMAVIQEYLAATGQVPIPHKYFLHPLQRSMALAVRERAHNARPPTRVPLSHGS